MADFGMTYFLPAPLGSVLQLGPVSTRESFNLKHILESFFEVLNPTFVQKGKVRGENLKLKFLINYESNFNIRFNTTNCCCVYTLPVRVRAKHES
jgi:hypothetical protein